jgi:hypothetical protein
MRLASISSAKERSAKLGNKFFHGMPNRSDRSRLQELWERGEVHDSPIVPKWQLKRQFKGRTKKKNRDFARKHSLHF